jgi:hypothetical protein
MTSTIRCVFQLEPFSRSRKLPSNSNRRLCEIQHQFPIYLLQRTLKGLTSDQNQVTLSQHPSLWVILTARLGGLTSLHVYLDSSCRNRLAEIARSGCMIGASTGIYFMVGPFFPSADNRWPPLPAPIRTRALRLRFFGLSALRIAETSRPISLAQSITEIRSRL